MEHEEHSAVSYLLAKEAIRDLVLEYSIAVADKNPELMASLFVADADFGSSGKGPEALKELMEATMGTLEMGIILVTNHRIRLINDANAEGEVWARCFAQTADEGYYEQLIKYVDKYRRTSIDALGMQVWKFEKRNHLLWCGEGKESPLLQEPANWPSKNIGIGRIPLTDPVIQKFRQTDN